MQAGDNRCPAPAAADIYPHGVPLDSTPADFLLPLRPPLRTGRSTCRGADRSCTADEDPAGYSCTASYWRFRFAQSPRAARHVPAALPQNRRAAERTAFPHGKFCIRLPTPGRRPSRFPVQSPPPDALRHNCTDRLQSSGDTRWSVRQSPYRGDSFRPAGFCISPPFLLPSDTSGDLRREDSAE